MKYEEHFYCGCLHICPLVAPIIGSDNGLLPDRHQFITWPNVGILLNGPLGIKLNEILIEIHTFPFKKIHLKTTHRNGVHFVSVSVWRQPMETTIHNCCTLIKTERSCLYTYNIIRSTEYAPSLRFYVLRRHGTIIHFPRTSDAAKNNIGK